MSVFPEKNLYFEGFNDVRKLWVSLSHIPDPEERVRVLREQKNHLHLPYGDVEIREWNPRTHTCEVVVWQSDLYFRTGLKTEESELEKLWDKFQTGCEVSFQGRIYVGADVVLRGKIVLRNYECVTVELFSPLIFVTETITKRFLRAPTLEKKQEIRHRVDVSYFNLLN